MNENLNLVEILKDCPKGTKLYSPVYEYVELVSVSLVECAKYPIEIKDRYGASDGITKDGRIYEEFNGECMLFPSKEQRDWSKFNVPDKIATIMNENLNMENKEIKELIIQCVDKCAEYEMYPKDIFNEIYDYIDKWYKDEN